MGSRQPSRPRTLDAGADAEDRALAWLEQHHLELVARNYRSRFGELDLVMLTGDRRAPTLVVVEVRCRLGRSLTPAAFTVDARKQRRLMRATLSFVTSHARYADLPIRFDVIGIDGGPAGQSSITWIQDAFRPES